MSKDKKGNLPNKDSVSSKVSGVTSDIEAVSKAASTIPEVLTNTAMAIPKAIGAIATAPGKLIKGLFNGLFGGDDKPEASHITVSTAQPVQQIPKLEAVVRPQKGIQVVEIRLENLLPNPAQPRKYFNEQSLNELAASITREGVIEPIIVRELRSGKFEIIAGERRFRATRKAKLKTIPAIIKNVNDAAAFELSVVENIQRENLNGIEEAEAYKVLIDKYRCTQEEIAAKVGKDRTHIAHMLRILTLPESVLGHVKTGELSASHARVLVGEDDPVSLANEILQNKLSVQETKALPRISGNSSHEKTMPLELGTLNERAAAIEKYLSIKLRRKVKIEQTKLTVWCASMDELEDLVRKMAKEA